MSIRYNFEFMKFVSYNMEGRMGGSSVCKLAQRNEITMIKFEVEFRPETHYLWYRSLNFFNFGDITKILWYIFFSFN